MQLKEAEKEIEVLRKELVLNALQLRTGQLLVGSASFSAQPALHLKKKAADQTFSCQSVVRTVVRGQGMPALVLKVVFFTALQATTAELMAVQGKLNTRGMIGAILDKEEGA